MAFLTINGVKTYVEDEGKGKETLIFGHSMLFNLRMFDQQVELLSEHYRCIRYDFRGHGKTDGPFDGYDLDTLTEDFATLVNTLNCGPCHFVGFSMGGMVAMRAAIQFPELIKSLILIDTSSDPEPKSGMLRNTAMLVVAKHIGLAPLAPKVMSMFFGKAFLTDPKRKELYKEWKNHFVANKRPGIVKAVKGVLFREGISHKISQIQQPTTILVGDKDELTDLSKAQLLNENIKDSVLKIIPRAGHMSPVEEPSLVNQAIQEHLNRVLP